MDNHTTLLAAVAVSLCAVASTISPKKRKIRSKWLKQYRQKRIEERASYNFLQSELRVEDEFSFRGYLRMDENMFKKLLCSINFRIKKVDTIMRKAIPPAEKLSIVLKYLARGGSFKSLDFESRCSRQFISQSVDDVCTAIYDELKDSYLKFPESKKDWKDIASKFQLKCQFPNCLGAMDGKRFSFKAKKKDDASFDSIVLLAVVDADSNFIYADVGCDGRVSNEEVLQLSTFSYVLSHASEFFPEDEIPIGSTMVKLPYVIVAGDAFSLQEHLMKSYLYTSEELQKIFNYRLSKPRSTVERAFHELTDRFGVFKNTINLQVEKVSRILQASVILHNFLNTNNQNSENDASIQGPSHNNQGNDSSHSPIANTHTREAGEIRDRFASYFSNEGALDSQQEYI